MACEKLCKAYLCGQGENPETLRSSHAYISGPLPVIARQQFAQETRSVRTERTWVIQAIRALARKIELLAPAGMMRADNPPTANIPGRAPMARSAFPPNTTSG
jgi:hypothetical protein